MDLQGGQQRRCLPGEYASGLIRPGAPPGAVDPGFTGWGAGIGIQGLQGFAEAGGQGQAPPHALKTFLDQGIYYRRWWHRWAGI